MRSMRRKLRAFCASTTKKLCAVAAAAVIGFSVMAPVAPAHADLDNDAVMTTATIAAGAALGGIAGYALAGKLVGTGKLTLAAGAIAGAIAGAKVAETLQAASEQKHREAAMRAVMGSGNPVYWSVPQERTTGRAMVLGPNGANCLEVQGDFMVNGRSGQQFSTLCRDGNDAWRFMGS